MIDDNELHDSEVLNELKDSTELSLQQILVSLISDKKNLTLKTEINNPRALACLHVFMKYFKQIGYVHTSKMIESFIDIYLEYMVSNDRKSRKEVIKALTNWFEKEYSAKSNKLLISQDNI